MSVTRPPSAQDVDQLLWNFDLPEQDYRDLIAKGGKIDQIKSSTSLVSAAAYAFVTNPERRAIFSLIEAGASLCVPASLTNEYYPPHPMAAIFFTDPANLNQPAHIEELFDALLEAGAHPIDLECDRGNLIHKMIDAFHNLQINVDFTELQVRQFNMLRRAFTPEELKVRVNAVKPTSRSMSTGKSPTLFALAARQLNGLESEKSLRHFGQFLVEMVICGADTTDAEKYMTASLYRPLMERIGRKKAALLAEAAAAAITTETRRPRAGRI